MSKQFMSIWLLCQLLSLPCRSREAGADCQCGAMESFPSEHLAPISSQCTPHSTTGSRPLRARFPLSPAQADLLVGFFGICSIWSPATVVGLDGEGVVLLQLTVQLLLGADYSLTSGFIHHHCFKGNILPVDLKSTDLTYRVKAKTG